MILVLSWWLFIYKKLNLNMKRYAYQINLLNIKKNDFLKVSLSRDPQNSSKAYLVEQLSYPVSWAIDCASQHGLSLIEMDVKNCNKNSSTTNTNNFTLVCLNFHLKGSFLKFMNFCENISKSPYLIEIQNCAIKSLENNFLDISCLIKFLIVKIDHV